MIIKRLDHLYFVFIHRNRLVPCRWQARLAESQKKRAGNPFKFENGRVVANGPLIEQE